MTLWQKVGASVAAVLLVLLGAGLSSGRLQQWLHGGKPMTGWNAQAIQSTFAGVQVREIDPANASVVFFYDLENKTDTDYQLAKGSNLVVMGRLKTDGSLSAEEPVTLTSAAFIPAKNRTRIGIQISHPFMWPQDTDQTAEDKIRGFVQGETGKLDGFVIFDQPTRYQIDLPGTWKEIQPISASGGRN